MLQKICQEIICYFYWLSEVTQKLLNNLLYCTLGFSMTRRKRLRRVAILCCHCLRNLAFYKAGWHNGSLILQDNFWTNVNGNFLDICVLEWCKLFGDSRGKQFWRKVLLDPAAFHNGLFHELGITEVQFDAYIKEMREYRDKFVAHLDSEEIMTPPVLEVTKISASYLYDYIISHEDEGNYFVAAPASSSAFYAAILKEGESVYKQLQYNN